MTTELTIEQKKQLLHETSKPAVTNIWDEWDGMQDVVAAKTPELETLDFSGVQTQTLTYSLGF